MPSLSPSSPTLARPSSRRVWWARGLLLAGGIGLAAALLTARSWLAGAERARDAQRDSVAATVGEAGAWPPPPDNARTDWAKTLPTRFQGLYESPDESAAVLGHYRSWFVERGWAPVAALSEGGTAFVRGGWRADLDFFPASADAAGCAFRVSVMKRR